MIVLEGVYWRSRFIKMAEIVPMTIFVAFIGVCAAVKTPQIRHAPYAGPRDGFLGAKPSLYLSMADHVVETTINEDE